MAFQAGDIRISGTFDELSFYHSVYGWLVRRKGGPTRKQFKTSPAFARSRESSGEFTACARAAAAVRRLVLAHTAHRDKALYHRLMKLMRLLANDDQCALRGQRDPLQGMQTAQGQVRLKAFAVTANPSLYDVLLGTGFVKELHEKVEKCSAPVLGSANNKPKRRTLARVFNPRVKAPLKHLLLNKPQQYTLHNTAFG